MNPANRKDESVMNNAAGAVFIEQKCPDVCKQIHQFEFSLFMSVLKQSNHHTTKSVIISYYSAISQSFS